MQFWPSRSSILDVKNIIECHCYFSTKKYFLISYYTTRKTDSDNALHTIVANFTVALKKQTMVIFFSKKSCVTRHNTTDFDPIEQCCIFVVFLILSNKCLVSYQFINTRVYDVVMYSCQLMNS